MRFATGGRRTRRRAQRKSGVRARGKRPIAVLPRLRTISPRHRNDHGISVRALYRDFRIEGWEVEQAEKLGWISVSVRKPLRGRPSTRVLNVSKNQPAKYPPFRYAIPKWIKWKHRRFAEQTQNIVTAPNAFGWRRLSKAEAYMRAYPECRNRYAAAASASRLMKRTDVRLMIRWLQCELDRRVQPPMPVTVEELIEQLEPLGVLRMVRRLPRHGF